MVCKYVWLFLCVRAVAWVTQPAWKSKGNLRACPDSPPHLRQGPLVVHQTYARLDIDLLGILLSASLPSLYSMGITSTHHCGRFTRVLKIQAQVLRLAWQGLSLLGSVAPGWEEFLICKRSSECLVCKQAILNATWSWPSLTQGDSWSTGQTDGRCPKTLPTFRHDQINKDSTRVTSQIA